MPTRTPDLKINPIKPQDPANLIDLYKDLDRIHDLYREGQRVLEATLNIPICISCGKCCEVTSVAATVLEVQYLCSWLMGSAPAGMLQKVVDLSEGWLLQRHSNAHIYEGTKDFSGDLAMMNKLTVEADGLLIHQPCPFMTEENRCLIHEAKPIICIAYGITRLPHQKCPRPYGKGETEGVRGHLGGKPAERIRQAVIQMNRDLAKLPSPRASNLMQTGFVPTLVFGTFRPQKMAAYITDNKIATCKFIQFVANPAVLWQEQLNRMWEMEHIVRGS
jgi:Fe-S-cluster containining protein